MANCNTDRQLITITIY